MLGRIFPPMGVPVFPVSIEAVMLTEPSCWVRRHTDVKEPWEGVPTFPNTGLLRLNDVNPVKALSFLT